MVTPSIGHPRPFGSAASIVLPSGAAHTSASSKTSRARTAVRRSPRPSHRADSARRAAERAGSIVLVPCPRGTQGPITSRASIEEGYPFLTSSYGKSWGLSGSQSTGSPRSGSWATGSCTSSWISPTLDSRSTSRLMAAATSTTKSEMEFETNG